MKFTKYFAVLAVIAFSLSLSVFARDNNEGKFTLVDTAQVGSTQLKAGTYKATWEGSGPDVQVKILEGKNVVASTSAKLVDNSSSTNSVTLKNSDKAKTVDEINFGGLHKSLVFSSTEAAQK